MKNLMVFCLLFQSTLLLANTTIEVKSPYIRLMPSMVKNNALFLELKNKSKKDLRLYKVKSDIAKKIEIHNHLLIDGMMKMREIPVILIKKGETVQLKPGSFHIMLFGMQRPLKENDKVSFELLFENAPSKKIKALVIKK